MVLLDSFIKGPARFKRIPGPSRWGRACGGGQVLVAVLLDNFINALVQREQAEKELPTPSAPTMVSLSEKTRTREAIEATQTLPRETQIDRPHAPARSDAGPRRSAGRRDDADTVLLDNFMLVSKGYLGRAGGAEPAGAGRSRWRSCSTTSSTRLRSWSRQRRRVSLSEKTRTREAVEA